MTNYEYQKRYRAKKRALGLKWARGNIKAQQTRYRQRAKKRIKIYKQVFNALRKGLLVKPNKCEFCFEKRLLMAHHQDYNKPLEIIWICHLCHYKLHITPKH